MRQSLVWEAWVQWLIIPLTYSESIAHSQFIKSSIIMDLQKAGRNGLPYQYSCVFPHTTYIESDVHRNKIINGLGRF